MEVGRVTPLTGNPKNLFRWTRTVAMVTELVSCSGNRRLSPMVEALSQLLRMLC